VLCASILMRHVASFKPTCDALCDANINSACRDAIEKQGVMLIKDVVYHHNKALCHLIEGEL
jgi:hypothetical protein